MRFSKPPNKNVLKWGGQLRFTNNFRPHACSSPTFIYAKIGLKNLSCVTILASNYANEINIAFVVTFSSR